MINEKYAGISGKMQGEKKENNPAAKETEYGMDSVNIFYVFRCCGFRLMCWQVFPLTVMDGSQERNSSSLIVPC